MKTGINEAYARNKQFHKYYEEERIREEDWEKLRRRRGERNTERKERKIEKEGWSDIELVVIEKERE